MNLGEIADVLKQHEKVVELVEQHEDAELARLALKRIRAGGTERTSLKDLAEMVNIDLNHL